MKDCHKDKWRLNFGPIGKWDQNSTASAYSFMRLLAANQYGFSGSRPSASPPCANHSCKNSDGLPLTAHPPSPQRLWRAGRSRIDSDGSPLTAHCSLTKAFTLLEVLLAMMLVTVMVLLISNLFSQVSGVWNIGTQTADMNTAARAALDLVATELSQAVAGPIDQNGAIGTTNLTFYQVAEDEMHFLALTQEPGGVTRTLCGVYFRLNNYALEYYRQTNNLDCYRNPWSPAWSAADVQPIISNVWDLQFFVSTNDTGAYLSPSLTPLNQLPCYVDISIRVLGDDDARKAVNLPVGSALNNFLDRNARRYTTRVYFLNREGYRPR